LELVILESYANPKHQICLLDPVRLKQQLIYQIKLIPFYSFPSKLHEKLSAVKSGKQRGGIISIFIPLQQQSL
jgi:hypothetical protein